MVHHIRAKDENAFRDTIGNIEKINLDASKHLTSKLGEKKGKLEGWFVTFLKDLASLLPGVHMARTSPKSVAKAVAQFAKDHADKKHPWLTTGDQAKLEKVLVDLKGKIKTAKNEAYLKKYEAGIDKAIGIIKSLKAKPGPGPGPGPTPGPSDPANFPELKTPVDVKKYFFNKVLQEESADTEKMLEHAIANGSKVNDKSSGGDPAIIVALTNNNKTAAKFLINHQANIQVLSPLNFPVLYFAMEMAKKTGDTEVLELIVSKRKGALTLDSNVGPGMTLKAYFENEEAKQAGSTAKIRQALNI